MKLGIREPRSRLCYIFFRESNVFNEIFRVDLTKFFFSESKFFIFLHSDVEIFEFYSHAFFGKNFVKITVKKLLFKQLI